MINRDPLLKALNGLLSGPYNGPFMLDLLEFKRLYLELEFSIGIDLREVDREFYNRALTVLSSGKIDDIKSLSTALKIKMVNVYLKFKYIDLKRF